MCVHTGMDVCTCRLARSWKVRTSSEVTRLCVAKELHALRTGVYVALEVKRNQLILWRV